MAQAESACASLVAIEPPGPGTPARNALPVSISVHGAVPAVADAGLGEAGFVVADEIVEEIFAVGSCGCGDGVGGVFGWESGDKGEGESEGKEEEKGFG